jgi:hypothetical protein
MKIGLDAEMVKTAARGREIEVLLNVANIPEDLLDGKGHPCPWCNGSDRFSLMCRDRGAVICRRCFAKKNGDFLSAVMRARSVDFSGAVKLVADYLTIAPAKATNKPATKKPHRVFKTAREGVAFLQKLFKTKCTRWWAYQNKSGEAIGVVARWDIGGDKTIRPISLYRDGWRIAGMPKPHPLYQLPSLLTAELVYVCEGEKAADAARCYGLVATTSPHGAQSAKHADWSALAGKRVIILPDNDAAGEEYAAEVAGILCRLQPSPIVRVIRLSGLPEGGDIADWHGSLSELEA